MRGPEFLTRKTCKQVIERFTKPAGITDRVIRYDKRFSHADLICAPPRKFAAQN